MKLRLNPGECVGPAFLKLYTPGDQFVLLRYWPIWNLSWWRSLWRQPYAMRRLYLEWTDARAFGMSWYIAFGIPVWFFPRTESKSAYFIGKNRGKHLLVVRGMFRIWPLWPTSGRRYAHVETLLYPVGEQERIEADLFRCRTGIPMDVQ